MTDSQSQFDDSIECEAPPVGVPVQMDTSTVATCPVCGTDAPAIASDVRRRDETDDEWSIDHYCGRCLTYFIREGSSEGVTTDVHRRCVRGYSHRGWEGTVPRMPPEEIPDVPDDAVGWTGQKDPATGDSRLMYQADSDEAYFVVIILHLKDDTVIETIEYEDESFAHQHLQPNSAVPLAPPQ